jgi:DNA polymerase III epsilon subunit-like protein
MFNISLDLETLGTDFNAPIIAIGAVCFTDEGETISEFENYIMPDFKLYEQMPSFDTIKWWTEQSREASSISFSGTMQLKTALQNFSKFYKNAGHRIPVWSHASFDASIMKYCYGVAKVDCPVHYRDWCDLRTLQRICKITQPEKVGVAHTALDDARYQAKVVTLCLKSK